CSPVNRILLPCVGHSIIYLARTSPSGSSCLPLPAPKIPASNQEDLLEIYRNISGISTRKVYPHCTLLHSSVCSYHTFSPLLPTRLGAVCFLWHYSVFPHGKAHPLGGAML